MKVYYSSYTLTPKKKANRLSGGEKKSGILLKAILKDKTLFSDYFPHEALGDRSVEIFLEEFKFQNHEYDQKVFDLLLKDHSFQTHSCKLFYNHKSWSKGEELNAPVIKYKLQTKEDRDFLLPLSRGIRVRLDALGIFSREDYLFFIKSLPQDLLKHIDYVEDPLSIDDWSDLPLPSARDFFSGGPFDFYIYKPNCEFKPKSSEKIIFSSYLGGNLGRFQAYGELLTSGDLKLTHGIHTEGFFEEELPLFKGDYFSGFMPDSSTVKKMYQEINHLAWRNLCSM